jgi:hypothetical protein
MAEIHPHDPSDARPKLEHEPSDASLGGVASFAVSLVILGVIIQVVLWGMFRHLLSREPQVKPPQSVLAASHRGQLPPAPRLEGLESLGGPSAGLAAEQAAAGQYGWIDRKAGIVRIPVDEAINILADKLPSVPQRQPETRRPSASNSGRSAVGEP